MEDSTERRSLNHTDFHHSESVPRSVGLQAPEIFESIIIVAIRIIMMMIHTTSHIYRFTKFQTQFLKEVNPTHVQSTKNNK